MIEVKQAVQTARARATENLGPYEYSLEEIERDSYKGRDVWSITLGFPTRMRGISELADLGKGRLEYKRFLIDVETGELVAMQIRETATL